MDKIPKAKDFWDDNTFDDHEEALIEFAKLHVEAALKEASENVESFVIGGLTSEVNKESILNAYPLDLIK